MLNRPGTVKNWAASDAALGSIHQPMRPLTSRASVLRTGTALRWSSGRPLGHGSFP